MLVICKRASEAAIRPKYYPINRCSMWVVIDTDINKTVHGPTSRNVCQRFIDAKVKS